MMRFTPATTRAATFIVSRAASRATSASVNNFAGIRLMSTVPAAKVGLYLQ